MNKREIPTSITIGTRTYEVDATGYCARLESWIVRDRRTGKLTTIPAN